MSKDFNLMNIEDITKLGTVTENSNERYTYNGISVPRVTSIISKMIQEDSIIYWANSLGFKHMGYRKTLNQYADYGTKVHKAIELFLKNQTITFKVPDNPFNAFTYWWETINESNEVTILGQEHKMACKYYGGTYDLLLKIGNDTILVDFKTSNHVGYKYWLQLAAYTKILREEENINVDGLIILQLDKNRPKYTEYYLNLHNEAQRNYFAICERTFMSLLYGFYHINYLEREFDNVTTKN